MLDSPVRPQASWGQGPHLILHFELCLWTSLLAQWIRICLPMQGTWVLSWFGKVPHATKQLSLCTTSAEAQVPYSPCSTTREALAMRSPCIAMKSNTCSPQLEKAHTKQWRPSAAKKTNKMKPCSWHSARHIYTLHNVLLNEYMNLEDFRDLLVHSLFPSIICPVGNHLLSLWIFLVSGNSLLHKMPILYMKRFNRKKRKKNRIMMVQQVKDLPAM